jgi:predicted acetyltransferase
MNVALVRATRSQTSVLDHLLQLYEYDYSEYGRVDVDSNGVFPTVDTEALWQPDDHVFLIQVDANLAGFAFVTRHQSYLGDGDAVLLSEFFVMRKYRRSGIGEHVALTLFDRFPGRWEVGTPHGNLGGQAFWRSVLGRYAPDMYQEVSEGCERWQGPIWAFSSKGNGPIDAAQPLSSLNSPTC